MIWSIRVLVLGFSTFSFSSITAQELPMAITSDPMPAFQADISELSEYGNLKKRHHVNFAPSWISRQKPQNPLEQFADFSLRSDRGNPSETGKFAWKKGPESEIPDTSTTDVQIERERGTDKGFQWGPAVRQALLFLAVQHGYAMTQPKTREALKGPFLKDYFRSVGSLEGWEDGGRFFTNYIAHPMQGSFMGFIQVQNDPRGKGQTFGLSGRYWKSRMKAFAWTAAWSTQFEIGPISQASIGNVGLSGKQTYVDLVITPTVGLGMLIGEDILDKYIVRRLERYSGSFWVKVFSRTLLNPTRTMANIIRFKIPWHRDRGLR